MTEELPAPKAEEKSCKAGPNDQTQTNTSSRITHQTSKRVPALFRTETEVSSEAPSRRRSRKEEQKLSGYLIGPVGIHLE